MNPSITSKFAAFGFAAMVTFSIMASLDALATTEQGRGLMAAKPVPAQTACTDGARLQHS